MNNDLKLKLVRRFRKKKYCIGKLFINGTPFCDTKEPVDIGLYKGQYLEESEEEKYYACPVGTYELELKPSFMTTEEWLKEAKNWRPRFEVPGFSTVVMPNSKYWEDQYANALIESGHRHEFGGPDYEPYPPASIITLGNNWKPGEMKDTDYCLDILKEKYLIPAITEGRRITIEITRRYEVPLRISGFTCE